MPLKAGFYYSIYEGGEAPRKPVILIHGAGSSHLIWPAEIRRLSGQTVIALDLPGHGRSSGIGCQSVSDYTAAMIEFLAAQGIFQAAFIGHSMGGAIALQLALDFPQHVIGIGVISAGANFRLPPGLVEYLSSPAMATAGLRMLQDGLISPATPASATGAGMQVFASARPGVLYSDWLAFSRFDLFSKLPGINTPAYVACGSSDRLTSPTQAEVLSAALPISRLELFREAGHLLPMEQPLALAAGLQRFVDDLMAWNQQSPLRSEFPQTVENGRLRPPQKLR